MPLHWQLMGVMEPDWYEANTKHGGTVSLHMNWEETSWLLCKWDESADKYHVLFDVMTEDLQMAQGRAETWLSEAV